MNCTDEALPSSRERSWSSSGTPRIDLGADPDERFVLDAAQHAEHARAAQRIVDLEHHGGHQFAARGDQRIIGRQFVGQLLGPALLDEEHLVHLVQHGVEGFEIERREGTDLEAAVLLDLRDPLAALGPQLGVFGDRDDVGGIDLARHHGSVPASP